jgi:hypothetical protein
MRAEAHLRLLTLAGMQTDYSSIPDSVERMA